MHVNRDDMKHIFILPHTEAVCVTITVDTDCSDECCAVQSVQNLA
jgi:hypothetical protein